MANLPKYEWNITLGLRMVLAYSKASRLIILAWAGDSDSIRLIEWLVEER